MKRPVGRFVTACALALGACGDDPVTILDLTVVETVPVDFGAMKGSVPEAATVSLADLRDEPAYADHAADFACGALDAEASQLHVEALTVGPGATVLSYRVEVAPHGAGDFSLLARFNGSVVAGQKVPLSDPRVTLDPAGLARVASIVLGATPALDLQIVGEVPGDLERLQVAVSLALDFSSDAKGCPSTTSGR